MRARERHSGSAWVGAGSVAMAVLAVLALGATVLVAQRTLSDASDIIVRGEADTVVGAVLAELVQRRQPPTSAALEQVLGENAARGLRYVAIVDRAERRVVAEAGTPALAEVPTRPGEATVRDHRVRAERPLPMPWPMRELPPLPLLAPPHVGRPPPPPMLIIELEPPVIARLQGGLAHISLVAAIAGAVLLAVAVGLSRTVRRLRDMEQRRERDQRLVALGGMSSVMAHELRNPLTSLKGHAQLLAEELDDPRQKKKAERVVGDAERLEALTTSLLDFVRDGPIDRAPIAPSELVARSLEHLPPERVRVTLDGAPSAIVVDAARLVRALHNLVDNALQATNGDDPVEVSVSRDGGEGGDVVVTVRDRGPGLPATSDLAIFEPFVTTRVRGTGLGLPVARRIAEQHGGSLAGETHPDGGALFRLRLPAELAR